MENRAEFELGGHKFVFDTKDVREEEKWGKGMWHYVFKVRMRVDGKPFQTFEYTGCTYDYNRGKSTLDEQGYKDVLESLIRDMWAYLDEDVKECKENNDKLLSRLSDDEWVKVYNEMVGAED